MKKLFKTGDIVEVEWSDASGDTSGWIDIDTVAEQLHIMDVITVGYVLLHDKHQIIVCHSISEDEQVIAPIAIPTGWIRRSRKLK